VVFECCARTCVVLMFVVLHFDVFVTSPPPPPPAAQPSGATFVLERHASLTTLDTLHVTRHTSNVTRHTSRVTRHTSRVTRHTSHVTRHTSHVTRHTSHVTRHTSHVTRHTSHVTQTRPCEREQGRRCQVRVRVFYPFFQALQFIHNDV